MINAIELEDGFERITHTITVEGFLGNAITDEVQRSNAIKALCEERVIAELIKHIRFHHNKVGSKLITTIEFVSR